MFWVVRPPWGLLICCLCGTGSQKTPRRHLLPPDLVPFYKATCWEHSLQLLPRNSFPRVVMSHHALGFLPGWVKETAAWRRALLLCQIVTESAAHKTVGVSVPNRKVKAVNTFRSSGQEKFLSPQPQLLPIFYLRKTMMSPFLLLWLGRLMLSYVLN